MSRSVLPPQKVSLILLNPLPPHTHEQASSFDDQPPHHGYRAGDHIPGTHPSETSEADDDERAVGEILKILRTRVEAIDDLRKVFKRFDSDHSGRISGEELRLVISEAYHIDFTESQFEMLMSHLDMVGGLYKFTRSLKRKRLLRACTSTSTSPAGCEQFHFIYNTCT
jgi:hypothetical protein